MSPPSWVGGLLANNWQFIQDAPLAALTLMFIGGAIAFILLRFLQAEKNLAVQARFEAKDAELQLKQRIVSDYESRLQGATPKEAEETIVQLQLELRRLKSQVGSLAPHRMSRNQVLAFSRQIQVNKREIAYIFKVDGSADAENISLGLIAAFRAAQWEVHESPYVTRFNRENRGITIAVEQPGDMTPAQQAVVEAVRQLGLSFFIQAAEATAAEDVEEIHQRVEIGVSSLSNPIYG